jgi:hypothetical protein
VHKAGYKSTSLHWLGLGTAPVIFNILSTGFSTQYGDRSLCNKMFVTKKMVTNFLLQLCNKKNKKQKNVTKSKRRIFGWNLHK